MAETGRAAEDGQGAAGVLPGRTARSVAPGRRQQRTDGSDAAWEHEITSRDIGTVRQRAQIAS